MLKEKMNAIEEKIRIEYERKMKQRKEIHSFS